MKHVYNNKTQLTQMPKYVSIVFFADQGPLLLTWFNSSPLSGQNGRHFAEQPPHRPDRDDAHSMEAYWCHGVQKIDTT